MNAAGNLNQARRNKEDDFYTQLGYIEKEINHYKKHFKGKVVYCNCDDPSISNFFHYFSHNFKNLGLKKLITTCYKNQNRDLFSRHDQDKAVYLKYEGGGGQEQQRVPDAEEIGVHPLNGDGDFRSKECIDLLKKADVIVTNPPFSLFREYVAQLIEYEKQFLIIGNMNAASYKEIFPLIKDNKIWLGNNTGHMEFKVPQDSPPRKSRFWIDEEGQKWRSMGNACWFTNLDYSKRHENLILYKKYTPQEHPGYDNYDAIEVSKTKNIPSDYNDIMGVPITFLDKYNPQQFEIVGSDYGVGQGLLPELVKRDWSGKLDRGYIQGKRLYSRIFIRRINHGN